jgi:hypothetical protein
MNRRDPGAKRKPPSPAELRGETHDPSAIVTILAGSRNEQRDDPHGHPAAGHIIESLLSIGDLCHFLKVNRRTLERMRSAGRLPSPSLFVGNRSPRWTRERIRAWVESGGQS